MSRHPSQLLCGTLLVVAITTGGAGCESASNRAPAPVTVDPSSGPNDIRIEIEVQGELEPRAHSDFSTESRSSLDARFQAWLVPAGEGARLALEDVALVAPGTLRAFVPAGIPEGSYAVAVLDPGGLERTLEGAYRALSPAHSVSRLLVAPISAQVAGLPFAVTASTADALGRTVIAFESDAHLSVATGTLILHEPPRFVAGRLTALVSLEEPAPENVLRVEDDQGRSATSIPFSVSRGLPAALQVRHAPATLLAGRCSEPFEVRLEDLAGRPAEAPIGSSIRLGADRPGLDFFSDDECASPVVAVALSPTDLVATFRVLATRSGAGVLWLASDAVPAVRHPVEVSPASATRLGFLTPSREMRVGECSEVVAIQSLGPDGLAAPISSATDLHLTAPAELELFQDPACSLPAAQQVLRPDQPSTTLYLRGGAEGRYVLAVEAGALLPTTQSALVLP
ncbi:MAG: hypothetical protein HY901_21770 [Deltaproteobacteria bacterium]|nr:hypothetical protein [Deltaproteobacteria bacterium]